MKNLLKRCVSLTVNGKVVNVPAGTSVLDATNHVLGKHERVPTICYHPYLSVDGNCRICLVEQKFDWGNKLIASCATEVSEGMEIFTNTSAVNDNVRSVLKFLLASHPLECPTCDVNGECLFQDLLAKYNVSPKDLGAMKAKYLRECDELMENDLKVWGSDAIKLDRTKCLHCTRCIRVCNEIQGMNILGMKKRGNREEISVFNDQEDFDESNCISCGQCTFVCPTGAITVNTHVKAVADLLRQVAAQEDDDEGIVIVASTAPTVRVTIAEDLGLAPGDLSTGKLVAGLRELGFEYVFDTNFTADLTIIEEGNELIERIKNGGEWPMFTSCCPAWVTLCEKKYPHLIPNLSSCRSPQGMMGSLIKEYWSEKEGIDRDRVVSVSIMPCTAKKDEIKREQLAGEHDYVLTVRELARLFKLHNVNVPSLDDAEFDNPLGSSSGAGVIFGSTGGVMEAALRTAYEVLTGEELPGIDFKPVRGLDFVKEATVTIGDLDLNIAVVHTAKQTQKLLEKIENGEKFYHFVEVMSCPSGCIGGGGNPKWSDHYDALQIEGSECMISDLATQRMEAIYDLDEKSIIRKSHENPQIIELYADYLHEPLGEISHHILHTFYTNRQRNDEN